ncbi:MAG: glutamate--tRNA ligase [Fimbriimonadaceae bacterium]|nr:glutamate--tRNA ligase [Chthonomonadaceae bacterium]MCO5296007.1 glutamate--tRNA ligase [Fimbriimonadaceae bacterium]
MSVRVRYAPSPTGSPHVGNIRTALYCHLLAKHQGGTMTVRIEDTDRARLVEGCEAEIFESLEWIGIEWQEGPEKGGPHAPYRQSERQAAGLYAPHIATLLESGHAYKAFETPEELAALREAQQANKEPVGYFGGQWREATADQVARAEVEGKPYVIRLKMPRDRRLTCEDAIRGRIEWEPGLTDDPVLIKADGMPTYHFAAMVDDHLMGTTHIIRGEEWISSAPKHVWLFEAFGWTPPIFVHVPVIKGPDGAKLSKRHGDTRCLDFRSAGYLPEALANFIALIGWSPGGDKELMGPDELVAAFDLSGLQPSPGVFDIEKLNWMNGQFIRQLDPDDLVARVRAFVEHPETAAYWEVPERRAAVPEDALARLARALAEEPEYAGKALPLLQERVVTLADFVEGTAFFFVEQPEMDPKAAEKWLGQPHVPQLFADLVGFLEGTPAVSVEACEQFLRGWAESNGFEKLGPIVHPTRVALTGRTVGPGLFELMSVLGPERMRSRLVP